MKILGMEGKSFGVFGLGKTGLTSAEALVSSGAEVYSYDENEQAREKTANTPYLAEHPTSWPWQNLNALVLSPGVPLTHPKPHAVVRKAREVGVEIIGDIEIFARTMNAMPKDRRAKIVAVTGSNGKSTTTSLIAHILREAGHRVFEGGNIGEAVLGLPQPEENSIYVLELSSYQLDLTHSLKADIAVLLNISPDHLDRHGGMDGYVMAKKRIFRNQDGDDFAFIGVDDDISQTICTDQISHKKANVVPVSVKGTLGHGVFALGGEIFYNFENKTIQAGKIPDIVSLRGQHNFQNAAVAFAVCNRLGVSPPLAMMAMAKFTGLPHRMEYVAEIDGVTFINDSKATNADAVIKAFGAFDSIFWIAGGKAKEGGIEDLDAHLTNVRTGYFYGESANLFAKQVGHKISTQTYTRINHAVDNAFADALSTKAKNPVVLLSPAAASFDQYKNFEERGDVFRKIVNKIAQERGKVA